MNALVFDTETTGLPYFNERSGDPRQPHIVQFAAILLNDDGTPGRTECVIVRPNGWVIDPISITIHGITQERALDEGVPEDDAVDLFLSMQARGAVRVAHNISFDTRIMRIAMTRAGIQRDMIEAIEKRQSYCTCNASTPIVNIPPTEKMVAAGITRPKSASLLECMAHFFGETLPGAHDALVDARACGRLYVHLQGLHA